MEKKIKDFLNFYGLFDELPFRKGFGKGVIFAFFLFLIVRGNNLLFNKDYSIFFISLEIFLLGIILKSFAGGWFEKLWNFNGGIIKNKWNKIGKIKLTFRRGVAFFGSSFLAFFHIFNYFVLREDYNYLAYEQFSIGIMFILLFIWFIFQEFNTAIEDPKKIAFTIFFMGILMIAYDFCLGQLQYILNNGGWVLNISLSLYMPFGLLIYLFFPELSVL